MSEIGYVVLVRIQDNAPTAIMDDDGALATFADEDAADKFMSRHILGTQPYQVVELEI